MSFVRRRRLERALEDLVRSRPALTVTAAAARWGFSDSSHLVHACRRRHEQTPTEYVKMHGAATRTQET